MEYVYISDALMDYIGIYDWTKTTTILISFAIFVPRIIAGRLPVYRSMAKDEELQRDGTASASASGTTSLITASPCRSVVSYGVNLNPLQEYLSVSRYLSYGWFTRRNHDTSAGEELSSASQHSRSS